MAYFTQPPNCEDCGLPMVAEWDTSNPREPKRVGWRCRQIHPVPRATRERLQRHESIKSLSARLPRLDQTAATCRQEHRTKYAEQAAQARQRIETLKAECSTAGCERCCAEQAERNRDVRLITP
jgi:hypothetical protein